MWKKKTICKSILIQNIYIESKQHAFVTQPYHPKEDIYPFFITDFSWYLFEYWMYENISPTKVVQKDRLSLL